MALLHCNYNNIPTFFMTIKHNSIAYLRCLVESMSDYVSYVYSVTSEINLHVIFGRLCHALVHLVQNTMTNTCLQVYVVFFNIHCTGTRYWLMNNIYSFTLYILY